MHMYLILYVYLVMHKKCFFLKNMLSVKLVNCVWQIIENIFSKLRRNKLYISFSEKFFRDRKQ